MGPQIGSLCGASRAVDAFVRFETQVTENMASHIILANMTQEAASWNEAEPFSIHSLHVLGNQPFVNSQVYAIYNAIMYLNDKDHN